LGAQLVLQVGRVGHCVTLCDVPTLRAARVAAAG
jgi:hypothetical protein